MDSLRKTCVFLQCRLQNDAHFISASNVLVVWVDQYRKISNINRTQSQNLNDSRLVLQLPFPNYIWVINN